MNALAPRGHRRRASPRSGVGGRRLRRPGRAQLVRAAPLHRAGARPRDRAPLRILQISDLHLVPRQRRRSTGCAGWPALAPDLVVNSGDNLAATRCGARGAARDGAAVRVPRRVRHWGPTTTTAPAPKNPARYLTRRHAEAPPGRRPPAGRGPAAPGCVDGGWVDLDNVRDHADGRRAAAVELVGTGDAHIRLRPVCRGGRPRVARRGRDHRRDARALPAGARPDGRRRGPAGHRRAHPRRPAGAALLRRAGDQLRPADRPRQGASAGAGGPGSRLARLDRSCTLAAPTPPTPPGCTCRPGSAPRRTPRCGSPAAPRPPCSPWSPAGG